MADHSLCLNVGDLYRAVRPPHPGNPGDEDEAHDVAVKRLHEVISAAVRASQGRAF